MPVPSRGSLLGHGMLAVQLLRAVDGKRTRVDNPPNAEDASRFEAVIHPEDVQPYLWMGVTLTRAQGVGEVEHAVGLAQRQRLDDIVHEGDVAAHDLDPVTKGARATGASGAMSMQWTSCPCSTSRRITRGPMKPLPPSTATRIPRRPPFASGANVAPPPDPGSSRNRLWAGTADDSGEEVVVASGRFRVEWRWGTNRATTLTIRRDGRAAVREILYFPTA